jgi:hypothetical protein
MNHTTCARCQASVPANQIDYTADGATCRQCLVAANTDPIKVSGLAYELGRATGRKHIIAGVVLLACGITILALGIAGGSTLVILPIGLVIASLYELGHGFRRLSSNP